MVVEFVPYSTVACCPLVDTLRVPVACEPSSLTDAKSDERMATG